LETIPLEIPAFFLLRLAVTEGDSMLLVVNVAAELAGRSDKIIPKSGTPASVFKPAYVDPAVKPEAEVTPPPFIISIKLSSPFSINNLPARKADKKWRNMSAIQSHEIIAYRYSLGTENWYTLCYNPVERHIIQKTVHKLNAINNLNTI
jgi:hypothetical protein